MTSIPFLPYVTPGKVFLALVLLFVPFSIILGKSVLRSFQIARKLPGPSLWEILTVHRKALMSSDIVNCLFELTSRYDYKPWTLWTPTHHVTVISDPETLGKAYKSEYVQSKEDKVYNGVAEYLGPNVLTLNGPTWKVHRNIITPSLNKAYLERNMDVINEEADRFTREVSGKADGTDLDIHHYVTKALARSSLRSLAERELDVDEKLVDKICFALDFGMPMCQKKFTNPLGYYLLVNFDKTTKDLVKKIHQAIQDVLKTIEQAGLMVDRQASEELPPETPLQALVEASNKKNMLAKHEIRSELLILLTASLDTTATAITAAICMLALHPEVQRRARDEIKSTFGDTNRPTTPEDLRRLEYLECVIKESIRLFPPGGVMPRRVDEETVLNGTVVPRGSTVVLNAFALHRNPKVFRDPLKFDPDRFSPGAQEERHPYAYLPFSSGPRNCVGRLHAMITMKTMLSSLLRNHKILPGRQLKNVCDIKVEMKITLQLDNPSVRLLPVNVVQ